MYKTNDLGFTTALVTLGFTLDHTDGERQVLFYFDNKDGVINQLALDYMNDVITVPAKSYFNNIKTIKNVLRGEP